jgi:hypothetical protein
LPNNQQKVASRLGAALDSFDAQAIVLVKYGTGNRNNATTKKKLFNAPTKKKRKQY